jgi:hypothetical protein
VWRAIVISFQICANKIVLKAAGVISAYGTFNPQFSFFLEPENRTKLNHFIFNLFLLP